MKRTKEDINKEILELITRGTGKPEPYHHSTHYYHKLKLKYPNLDLLINPSTINQLSAQIHKNQLELIERIPNYIPVYESTNKGDKMILNLLRLITKPSHL